MAKIIEFQEALEKGLLQEEHYFETTATQRSVVTVSEDETEYYQNQHFITEQGEKKLWRLVEVGKTAKECRMFGSPTKERLTLRGRTGYLNGISVLGKIAKGTNILPEFFADVHSCRFPKIEYRIKFWDRDLFWEKMQSELRKYEHKDDIGMRYFLASRCVVISSSGADFYLFIVSGGSVGVGHILYNSGNGSSSFSYAVRPEAIPKSDFLVEVEYCDGSKERPWICIPANGNI